MTICARLCFAFLAVVLCGNAQAFKKYTLKGITALDVVVENITDGAPLTKDQIKTDVELRLRKAGMVIDHSSLSYLYVRVGMMQAHSAAGRFMGYVYNIDVSCVQPAALLRDPNVSESMPTWTTGGFGVIGTDEAARSIRDDLDGYVDEFLNVFLEANPRSR